MGRVFGGSALHEESNNRNWLKDSDYIANLGGHHEFELKMSELTDHYSNEGDGLVFINDGAKMTMEPDSCGISPIHTDSRLLPCDGTHRKIFESGDEKK